MTQPVKFGLNVDPNTGGLPIAERITAIADASGLDLVGVLDHPYNDGFTDTLRCPRPTCHQTGCPNSTRSSPAPPATLAVTRPRLLACTTSWA